MHALEIFKVSIEKGVFVIPLYFEGKSSCFKEFHVIDFMRDRFLLNSIDDLLDLELAFLPTICLRKHLAHSLCKFALTATTSHKLFNRNTDAK